MIPKWAGDGVDPVACLFVGCCLVVLVSGVILVTVAPVPLLSKRDSGERLRKQLGSITGPDSAIMKTHENAANEWYNRI